MSLIWKSSEPERVDQVCAMGADLGDSPLAQLEYTKEPSLVSKVTILASTILKEFRK